MTDSGMNRLREPLVSVIVPVYLVENYLGECVDSILNQTYTRLEVILVDDGSPDRCGKICDGYADRDNRVKVIHKENGGLSDARNAGMKMATGELLTFVDSDDYLDRNFLAFLMDAMQKTGAEIAITGMKRTSSRNEKSMQSHGETQIFDSSVALTNVLYGSPFGTSACGKLFRRDLFDGIEFPFGKFSEDLFTIYKTILRSNRIVYCPFDGYFYFYREEGSIVVSGYREKHLQALEAVRNIEHDIGDLVDGKAIECQYLNIVYDIMARNPTRKEYSHPLIQNALRRSRLSVLKDSRAPIRLRCFALLSFWGYRITNAVITFRNRKWK